MVDEVRSLKAEYEVNQQGGGGEFKCYIYLANGDGCFALKQAAED